MLEALRPLVQELLQEELDRLPAGEPEPSPWLGVRAAAAYLGVSEGSIRQMIRRGTIPSHKVEGRRLLRRDELDAALSSDPENEARQREHAPGP
jgi:excisionase family DNA binding protein